tara:strand:- start:248 stop:502 length:255 start_codon:yes stop_codon:yes gene_type:complete
MSAKLVEQNTKNSINLYMRSLKKTSEHKQYFIFNLGVFITFIFIIGITLFIKYRIRNDLATIQKKDDDKRDFILNHLQQYQHLN